MDEQGSSPLGYIAQSYRHTHPETTTVAPGFGMYCVRITDFRSRYRPSRHPSVTMRTIPLPVQASSCKDAGAEGSPRSTARKYPSLPCEHHQDTTSTAAQHGSVPPGHRRPATLPSLEPHDLGRSNRHSAAQHGSGSSTGSSRSCLALSHVPGAQAPRQTALSPREDGCCCGLVGITASLFGWETIGFRPSRAVRVVTRRRSAFLFHAMG